MFNIAFSKRERLMKEIMKCMTLDYANAIIKNMPLTFDSLNALERAAVNYCLKNNKMDVQQEIEE